MPGGEVLGGRWMTRTSCSAQASLGMMHRTISASHSFASNTCAQIQCGEKWACDQSRGKDQAPPTAACPWRTPKSLFWRQKL